MIYECLVCQSEETRVVNRNVKDDSILKCEVCGTTLQRKDTASSTAAPRSVFRSPEDNRAFSLIGQPLSESLPLPSSGDTIEGYERNISQLLAQINPDLLIDLIDPSVRDMFQQMVNDESPNKVVNQKYLDEIGLLTVDSRKTVLWDVAIMIGPLHAVYILADFSMTPPANSEIASQIIVGNPIHGERVDEKILMNPTRLPDRRPSVLLERGKITFAQKYQTYSESSVDAIIISQVKGYKFPFIMTDNSQELQKINSEFVTNQNQTRFPVGMISERDADVIKRLAEGGGAGKERSETAPTSSLAIKIKVGTQINECPICVEVFECGEEIYKLGCRHIYHRHCLSRWVKSHPNCPLCRQPIHRKEKEDEKDGGSERTIHPSREMSNQFYL